MVSAVKSFVGVTGAELTKWDSDFNLTKEGSAKGEVVHKFDWKAANKYLAFEALIFPVYGAHAALRFIGENGKVEALSSVSLADFHFGHDDIGQLQQKR